MLLEFEELEKENAIELLSGSVSFLTNSANNTKQFQMNEIIGNIM